jgi:hypothetical protein
MCTCFDFFYEIKITMPIGQLTLRFRGARFFARPAASALFGAAGAMKMNQFPSNM